MISAFRITSSLEIVKHWDFFQEGLEVIAKKGKEQLDAEMMFKVLCVLATEPAYGWIGIATVDGVPQGFAAFQDATPLFARERSFINRVFWHKSGNHEVSVTLLNYFISWAKENNVKRVIVTTRRDSGAAIRCFQSDKYGFKKGYMTFEKEL